jgi:hypothetical protein
LDIVRNEGFFLDTYGQNCLKRIVVQARSSGGERYPDTVEVKGSNPFVPTMKIKELVPPFKTGVAPFLFLLPSFSKMMFYSLMTALME